MGHYDDCYDTKSDAEKKEDLKSYKRKEKAKNILLQLLKLKDHEELSELIQEIKRGY